MNDPSVVLSAVRNLGEWGLLASLFMNSFVKHFSTSEREIVPCILKPAPLLFITHLPEEHRDGDGRAQDFIMSKKEQATCLDRKVNLAKKPSESEGLVLGAIQKKEFEQIKELIGWNSEPARTIAKGIDEALPESAS